MVSLLSNTETNLLNQLPQGVVVADMNAQIIYINPVAETFFNKSLTQVLGLSIDSVVILSDEETSYPLETPGFNCISTGEPEDAGNNALLLNTDDASNKLPVDVTVSAWKNDQDEQLGILINIHDVRLSRFSRRQLTWQAERDGLTGLLNLAAFEQNSIKQVTDLQSDENILLWVELDHFDHLITLCGKSQVDDILIQIAETLSEQLPEQALIARHSDNIFLILLTQTNLAEATAIANNVLQLSAQTSVLINNTQWIVTASIGLNSFAHLKHDGVASLIYHTHQACTLAKQAGGNQLHIFLIEQQTIYEQQVAKLQTGLENHEFQLFFQKIIPVDKSKQESCEILLRHYDNETQEATPPSIFMPLCERSGLIRHIDRWVISQIQEMLLFSPQLLDQFDKIHINLSDYSLNCRQFMNEIEELLSSHLLPRGKLCFEINKKNILAKQPNSLQFIRQMSALGCHFCIDDVDGDLTIFHNIQNLSIYMIKTDPRLSVRATWQEHSAIMIKTMVNMAHLFNIEVVLQHIERPEMMETVNQIADPSFLQGFALHSPEPLSNLIEF